MAIISTQTTVTIGDAAAITTTEDMVLQPSVTGTLALRKLTYPNNTLAPLVYFQNPDVWTNFDTTPLVKRPVVGSLRTLQDNKLTGWQGFNKDASVTETWRGSGNIASMDLDFFRQLYAYYENPPTTGLITWAPCDRTSTVYNILIERLTVGGANISMEYLAVRQLCLVGDVVFRFRIVSTV